MEKYQIEVFTVLTERNAIRTKKDRGLIFLHIDRASEVNKSFII